MPMIDAEGCALYAEAEGPAHAPVLMFSNSLGTNLTMWDAQAKVLARDFRVVRYDRRGHGKSDVPHGPYSMDRLGRDALAIMDGLGLDRVNWCGLSMGGMVGQWLGANAPGRIEKLILSNTACYYPDKAPWADRIKTVREKGIAALAPITMERWFTASFREREPLAVERFKNAVLATAVKGYVGCCEAIRDMDHRELLPAISAPTLIIGGRYDPATPLAAAEYLRDRIPGASLAVLDTAHIANVEQPDLYTDVLQKFLRA